MYYYVNCQLVKEINGDSLVLYDLKTEVVHILNHSATVIFEAISETNCIEKVREIYFAKTEYNKSEETLQDFRSR